MRVTGAGRAQRQKRRLPVSTLALPAAAAATIADLAASRAQYGEPDSGCEPLWRKRLASGLS
jgi:hypothetical protein